MKSMLENIKAILDYAKESPWTTLCAVLLALSSLIIGQPSLVAFAGPSAALLIVQLAEFVQKGSVVIGLLFAKDMSGPKELIKEDVIPEILEENQPEGKEALVSPPAKAAKKTVKKKVAKKAAPAKKISKTK